MRCILAIGAHPDDVEFGCSGLLQQCSERHILVLTSGSAGGDPERRWAEAQESASLLGASLRQAELPDTRLELSPSIDLIEEELRRHRPDVVCAPSQRDMHQDHAMAARAARIASRDHPCTLLSYLAPSSAEDFKPNWFVPLTDEQMILKLRAVACHRTQVSRAYLEDEFVRGMAHYWAMVERSPKQFVEPFELVRRVEKGEVV